MNSISQNYINIINNNFYKEVFKQLGSIIEKPNLELGIFNYINICSTVDEISNEIGKNIILNQFKKLDEEFRDKPNRTKFYHVKSLAKRTILTVFGEITYYRTIYETCSNKESYCYVDRILGIEKHDYYDPYIKAIVLKYVAENSYTKTAKYINNLIANRVKLEENSKYLMSRQTVYNIVKKANLEPLKIENAEREINTLYIMADEHFVGSQGTDKDHMVKQVVVFEDIELIDKNIETTDNDTYDKETNNEIINEETNNNITNKKKKNLLPRRRLINKYAISVVNSSIHNETLNYIFNTYNIDKIKNIIVMGDGASWIQTLKNELKYDKDLTMTFGLDKYHFKQALHRIFLDEKLEKEAEKHIINNNKQDFIKMVNENIKKDSHREETIIKNKEYIINNIKSIIYLYDKKLSCPMESQISHNVASRFSSRPCGFGITNMKQLLTLKTMTVNKENIILTYLTNLNSQNSSIIINNNNLTNTSRYNLNYKDQEVLNTYGKIHKNVQFI